MAENTKTDELDQKIHDITQTMLIALSEWQAGVPTNYSSIKSKGREDLRQLINSEVRKALDSADKNICELQKYKMSALSQDTLLDKMDVIEVLALERGRYPLNKEES